MDVHGLNGCSGSDCSGEERTSCQDILPFKHVVKLCLNIPLCATAPCKGLPGCCDPQGRNNSVSDSCQNTAEGLH